MIYISIGIRKQID